MGENSKIAWCDHTFNPVVGCEKIGPGCDNCYAETWAKRSGQPELWQGECRLTKTWGNPIKWNREAEAKGIRYKVFCASLADVFDNKWKPEWRAALFQLIRETPHLDWIILTKRIGNVEKMLPGDWGDGYPNVWLMITVVNQEEANRDIPKLLKAPAALRGLSIEPQLDSIGLSTFLAGPKISWCIVGAESGPKRRPFDENWARLLRNQCQASGTRFFFKQCFRAGIKIETPELDGKRWMEFPK